MSDIDTDAIRQDVTDETRPRPDPDVVVVLCDEVDSLRAENELLREQALALALQLQRRLAEAVPSGNSRDRGR